MGKITLRGRVPKDDPMFSGRAEIFSKVQIDSFGQHEANRTEVEAEESAARQMQIGRLVQNVQFFSRSKGIDLGPVSPSSIFELVDAGVIEDWPCVKALRIALKKVPID